MINHLMGETGGRLSGLEGSECTDPRSKVFVPPTDWFLPSGQDLTLSSRRATCSPYGNRDHKGAVQSASGHR